MARYNVRDLLGHWVAPRSGEGKMCPHACCRGHRVHPANMPVILPSPLLHRASDQDLAAHYDAVDVDNPSPKQERAKAQVLHEMERRDRQTAERRRRREAVAGARAGRRMENEAEYERIKGQAEAETRGNWVNAAGRAAGATERDILTGPEAQFRRYASEEAREYFSANPRPTAGHFRGRDTRVGAMGSSAPRRRGRGRRGLGWAGGPGSSSARSHALGWRS